MSTVARLDGYALLSDHPVRWQLRSGVKPFEGRFAVRPDDAEILVYGGSGTLRPVSLVIDDGNGRKLNIENLYVLAEEERDNPNIAHILVVDRRWFWSHNHVSMAFNVRRQVGVKRRRVAGTPPELQPLTPRIAYHPASLKNGVPWTAKECIENVLSVCLNAESAATGYRANWNIDPSIGNILDDLPIEDVEIEDAADNALARLLTFMPEARVTVDAKGDIVVYSGADGADSTFVDDTGPAIIGHGYATLRRNARIRPKRIHVLFTREHELRFDFEESGTPTTPEDGRHCENVVSVPDYSLDLKNGTTVDQGTWISLVDALDAWGAPPRQGHLANAEAWLSALRRLMVPYLDLWTGIGLSGIRSPDADWMRRIGSIQQHYRKTWRINPRWMGRIRQLKASLVATVDPTSGTRAPALVYADYSRLSSMRSLWIDIIGGDSPVYSMNVKSYPKSNRLADGTPAPADVSILDQDQGIISLSFRPDPLGIYQSFVPGMMTLEGSGTDGDGRPTDAGPTPDINDLTRPITFNAISSEHRPPELLPEFKAAFLLTAVPAPWNSALNQHLFRVTIEHDDKEMLKLLPSSLKAGIQQSYGPDLEIRIGPTIETARVAWSDDASADIEESFGVTDGPGAIDELVVNRTGDIGGAGSLDAISKAIAARTWAALADRYQGSKGVPLEVNARPSGFVESVDHEVTTGGAVVTNFHWPAKLPDIDIFSLLPDSTRRIVLRLAPSPGVQ